MLHSEIMVSFLYACPLRSRAGGCRRKMRRLDDELCFRALTLTTLLPPFFSGRKPISNNDQRFIIVIMGLFERGDAENIGSKRHQHHQEQKNTRRLGQQQEQSKNDAVVWCIITTAFATTTTSGKDDHAPPRNSSSEATEAADGHHHQHRQQKHQQ